MRLFRYYVTQKQERGRPGFEDLKCHIEFFVTEENGAKIIFEKSDF